MPNFGGGYKSPFYNEVPHPVRGELEYRANAYGSRIRSVAPTENRDEGAQRLLWSYGKTAWARVAPVGPGPALGTSISKLMSDSKGKLLLYDQVRNVPKYPLLQSVEITNEGTMGSLIKSTINFTVFPKYTTGGFSMAAIENAYLKPGKEIVVEWGWSVRNAGANRGTMRGIIYNFEWNVNTDLSLSIKTSAVSKGSIAIGLSGEQHNPDATGGVEDPLGNQVYDTDLVGILEKDVIGAGGVKNTAVTLSPGTQISSFTGRSNPAFNYTILAIPRSLRDADQDLLSDEQKEKQEEDKAIQEENDKANQAIVQYADKLSQAQSNLQRLEKELADIIQKNPEEKGLVTDSARVNNYENILIPAARKELESVLSAAKDASGKDSTFLGFNVPDWTGLDEKANKFIADIQAQAAKITAARQQGQSVQPNAQVYKTETPEPIAEPTYYVSISQLANWFNSKINAGPFGAITSVQVDGNITQYLSSVVSCTPDKVYFPDSKKGTYGEFAPFSGQSMANGTNIDIGKILMSTTCIAETYREFLKENQTNISYKNITGFWDALIKKVNYASGETYQLTVRVVESTSIGGTPGNKAILSIEDANIPTSVNVSPYPFDATISRPILKNVSISSKPPGPLAAAAFATARGGSSSQLDVKVDKSGGDGLSAAISAIDTTKSQMIKTGVSDKWSQDLKGAYATYKRTQTDITNAHWLNKAIYPVNLTLTIDGIEGFHFGNVIKTSLVPAQYNAENLVFVITKVAHSIKDGVWETTLETRSRIGQY